ncbi:MAG: transglycosylase domain-containing protein, partial [Luteolibacter sp.]
MPKRQSPETTRPRKDPDTGKRGPGGATWLLFWPFLLFNLLIRRRHWFQRYLLRLVGFPAVAGLYLLLFFTLVYGLRAQRYHLGEINQMPERSIILDRTGAEIGRIHGEKRSIVPLRQVSENFRKAILAREDERFYSHGAIDPIGIGRAFLRNLQGKREGASTITQQLASDVFQLKRGEKRGDLPRQLDRKLLEIAIAIRIEALMEKDAILEAYINQINWGRQIRGVGEASRIYFEKHPEQLTLSESALLAGIVRGPDSFNPFKSMEAATRERDTTLDRMVNAKSITRAEAEAAKQDKIDVRPVMRRAAKYSFAMDAIRRDLEIILEDEDIQLGGLEIFTTIDLRIQQKAEQALEKQLYGTENRSGYAHPTRAAWQKLPEESRKTPRYLQGSAVVIENRTGGVLAIVGGRDARESRFNRAKEAKRQIGSVFKPFVYLAAFDNGMGPDTPVSDGPILPGEIKGGGSWQPRNSDDTFGGMMPASHGLVRSRNTMSVRVGNFAGISRVKEFAAKAGFSTPMPENPASFLGAWEASPWEVASAYTIFPNEGARYRPYLISEIRDRDGNVLFSTLPLPYQAASGGSARAVSLILEEVASRGTAASVRRLGFEKPCAGKTGTTNDFKDAWFAGYSSTLTCAVWVGFDQPKRIIHGGYGSTLALPVWVDILKTADRLDYKAGSLHDKTHLVKTDLCRLSGKRATAGCREAGTAFSDALPPDILPGETDFCPIHPARAMTVGATTHNSEPAPSLAKPVPDPPIRGKTSATAWPADCREV